MEKIKMEKIKNENEAIVLMLKNNESGFLEKELVIIPIEENIELVSAAYVVEEQDGLYVHLKLTCADDVTDEDFERVYEAYGDGCDFDGVDQIFEEDDCYNPTWEMIYKYDEDYKALAEKTTEIIKLHKAELDRIMNRR